MKIADKGQTVAIDESKNQARYAEWNVILPMLSNFTLVNFVNDISLPPFFGGFILSPLYSFLFDTYNTTRAEIIMNCPIRQIPPLLMNKK